MKDKIIKDANNGVKKMLDNVLTSLMIMDEDEIFDRFVEKKINNFTEKDFDNLINKENDRVTDKEIDNLSEKESDFSLENEENHE